MQHHARGLSRLEVLVVCVCLFAVFCLLMPGLDFGSRDPARRTQCAARLGQLVQSFMQFEMTKKKYPGYLNAYGQNDEGVVKVGTWAISLMPYIEQEPLFDEWADPSNTEQWNRWGGSNKMNDALYPKVAMFLCPSDYRDHEQAFSSFAVNAGFFPEALPGSYLSLDPHERARRSSSPVNGVFSNQLPAEVNCVYTKNIPQRVLGSRADSPTRNSDIHDGLTNTLAVVESLNADSWAYVGRETGWDTAEIDGQVYAGDDLNIQWSPRIHGGVVWQYRAQPSVKGVPNYAKPKLSIDKRAFGPEQAIPSSAHSGGNNVAMLGGAVSYMSKDIDYRVLQALMTPHTSQSDVPDPTYVLRQDDYE